jgi:microcystin-dependent protein
MSNARNISKLASLAAHVSNLVGLSNSKTSIDAAVAMVPLPSGTVLPYAALTAPTGFLLAYGQEVSRSTYAALFAVIGTTYGTGDGSTTFNLPDLRGRIPAGKDNIGGTAANRLTTISNNLGSTGGAETHTLTVAQMPSHSHTVSAAGTGTASTNYATKASTAQNTSFTTDTAGSGNAHNNVQPTIILTYIIKT